MLAIPPAVTTTGPVVAPIGTGAMIVSIPHVVGVAETPLKVTVPDVPKLPPLMVTLVPTGPDTGLTPVIVGPDWAVNITALLAIGDPLDV